MALNRKVIAVFLGLLSFLFISGCSNPDLNQGSQRGSVVLEFGALARGSTLLPDINMDVKEYVVTFSAAGEADVVRTVNVGSSVNVSLASKTWSVNVDAYNNGAPSVVIGVGSTTINILAGQTVSKTVSVKPLSGNGSIVLAVSWSGITVANPVVSAVFENTSGALFPKTFQVNGTQASLDTELPAGYYIATFTLKDGTTTVGASNGNAVRIVQGAVTSGSITFSLSDEEDEGSVVVVIVTDLASPVVVTLTGQQASVANDTNMTVTAQVSPAGTYSYQWYLDGDALSGQTGSSINIGQGLSVGSYVLTVRVSKASGALSSPDSPVIFQVTEGTTPEVGLAIHYKKVGTAPTIWLWEEGTDGRAIMTLEGHTWPGPAMTASTSADWWVWTIPQSYLPITKNLKFKFDAGAELTLTVADKDAGKTWYDGAWGLQPAAGKPTITISPDGGFFDPSVGVTVSLTADAEAPVTSASYTLNGGSPVAIVGNTANFNLTATTTLVVNATNIAGLSTKSVTFTLGSQPMPSYSWDNATVYFVMTDRFFDGNSANNNSYGRPQVDATGKNIGTFHGGDIAGLSAKLDANYFSDLGINAIWITAPYEQAHGWVGGGSGGDFAHYAYHGYYALDFSNLDANMGTKSEFKTFVRKAHDKGIRVIMDVVMNHTGYSTIKDMDEFSFGGKKAGFNVSWTPGSGQTWHSVHDAIIDYAAGTATEWAKFWGADWVRSGLPGYTAGGGDDLTKNLASLPDFKTEDGASRGLPTFLKNKATFGGAFSLYDAVAAKNQTKRVRDWLTEWLVQWVREYGIDGFRVDTAKHVEMDAWVNLKNQAKNALTAWRAAEAAKPVGDRDPAYQWQDAFWMTAEVWGHGPNQSNYHTSGAFDSVINFGFQGTAGSASTGSASGWDGVYSGYANSINSSTSWNSLSYISSHDTGSVFYNGNADRQKKVGTYLLLAPGGVQVFYGDEYGRANGENGSDVDQGSRSSMNWSTVSTQLADNASILKHWQKVGQFRSKNIAVGAGAHAQIATTSGYAFSRNWNGVSKAAVVADASGSVQVTVSTLWSDGTVLRNAYDGTEATVTAGKVTFSAGTNGLILIEKK